MGVDTGDVTLTVLLDRIRDLGHVTNDLGGLESGLPAIDVTSLSAVQ